MLKKYRKNPKDKLLHSAERYLLFMSHGFSFVAVPEDIKNIPASAVVFDVSFHELFTLCFGSFYYTQFIL